MWNNSDISASEIIADIMKAKKVIEMQQFFSMNRKTKEKVFKGSAEYDEMVVEDERVPDNMIISFDPSPDCSVVPEFIKVIDMTKRGHSLTENQGAGRRNTSLIQEYTGNRTERRAAAKERRRAEKRRNKH